MGTAQLGRRKEGTGWQEYPERINNRQVIRTLEGALQDLAKIDEQLQKSNNVQDYILSRETYLAIREMEDLKRREQRILEILETIGIAAPPFKTPLLLLFTLLGWRQSMRTDKLRELIRLMKELDEAFRGQGMEMQALIENKQEIPADLLMRFPGKHFFMLSLRSCGKAEIIFNEKRERFFRKKENGGLRIILPDPVAVAMLQATSLQKHYRPFFGGTSRAARRPLCRLMVVCEPSRLGKHRDELYQTFGEVKALSVHYEKGGSIFAVNREDVLNFVKEYLQFRINKEKTNDKVKR